MKDFDKIFDDMEDAIDDAMDDLDRALDDAFGDDGDRKRKKKGKGKKKRKKDRKAKLSDFIVLDDFEIEITDADPSKPQQMGQINARCLICNDKGTIGWLPRYDWLIYLMVFIGLDDVKLSRGWFRQPCECPQKQRPVAPKGSG